VAPGYTRAQVDEAVKRALEAAAEKAEITETCILPSGHFLSEKCANAIRALAADPAAVARIVEGGE
jgi:hypothetical protein